MRGGETTKTQEKKQEQDWMMMMLMLMLIDGNGEEQKNKKHDRPCVLLAQTYWSIAIPPNCPLCARCQIKAAQCPSEKEPGRLIPSDLGDMEEPFVAHTVGSYCRIPVRYKAQRTSSWPPCILSEAATRYLPAEADATRILVQQQAQAEEGQHWNNWPVAARRHTPNPLANGLRLVIHTVTRVTLST